MLVVVMEAEETGRTKSLKMVVKFNSTEWVSGEVFMRAITALLYASVNELCMLISKLQD
jgi:hypothetical protein